MSATKKLIELGIILPLPPAAAGAYVPAVRAGNMLYLSGALPMADGKLTHTGKIDPANPDRGVDYGYAAARQCALNLLANIKAVAGSLDAVKRVVFVSGFVNGVDDFADSPKVVNGASELFVALYGDAGKHARAAVSVNGLPLKASVEIQVVAELY